jgi:hypothetical protein
VTDWFIFRETFKALQERNSTCLFNATTLLSIKDHIIFCDVE